MLHSGRLHYENSQIMDKKFNDIGPWLVAMLIRKLVVCRVEQLAVTLGISLVSAGIIDQVSML